MNEKEERLKNIIENANEILKDCGFYNIELLTRIVISRGIEMGLMDENYCLTEDTEIYLRQRNM